MHRLGMHFNLAQRVFLFGFAVVTAACATVDTCAQMVSIPGLYTTGQTASGYVTGRRDINYVVTANTAGNTGYNGSPFTTSAPPSTWVAGTSTASWIVTRDPGDLVGNLLGVSGGNVIRPTGTYDFTLSFDMPVGAQLSTVSLSGTGAADDLAAIYVNGVLVAGQQLSGFSSLSTFTLNASNAAFTSGVNTVTFRVNNVGGGASGLLITGIGGSVVIPEAGAFLPVAGALGLYGFALVRRPARRPLSSIKRLVEADWRHAGL